MADPEIPRRSNNERERTGTLKSLTSVLRPSKINIKRKHLSRYSWLPDVFRYENSVIRNVAGPVFTVTLFASVVAYYDSQGKRINLTNNVVPLLSVVVGLILVFRNSTSYDRWNEGRKDFGALTSDIRNMARNIWCTVNLPPEQDAAVKRYMESLPVYLQQPHLERANSASSSSNVAKHQAAAQNLGVAYHLRNEKIRVVRLLIAFAIATKHHLRNEPGLDHDDYSGLIPPELYREEASGWERVVTTSPDQTFSATNPNPRHADHRKSHYSPKGPVTASTPLLTDSQRTVEFHAWSPSDRKQMPIPLIIAHEISRVLFRFKRFGCMDIVGYAMHNGLQTMLSNMVEQLTSMERVSNTPINASYSIHLKQCVTLYLFTLPFTLVKDLGFTMIPVVTVVAFTLMGIEGIADEIEHPFENNPSDHPLDKFCRELREEVEFMIERLPAGVEDDS